MGLELHESAVNENLGWWTYFHWEYGVSSGQSLQKYPCNCSYLLLQNKSYAEQSCKLSSCLRFWGIFLKQNSSMFVLERTFVLMWVKGFFGSAEILYECRYFWGVCYGFLHLNDYRSVLKCTSSVCSAPVAHVVSHGSFEKMDEVLASSPLDPDRSKFPTRFSARISQLPFSCTLCRRWSTGSQYFSFCFCFVGCWSYVHLGCTNLFSLDQLVSEQGASESK